MMAHGFVGTKTVTCGERELKLLIGPCEFEVSEL